MTPLEQAVFDLVDHNLHEPDPSVNFDAWVKWSIRQGELIRAVQLETATAEQG